METILIHFGAQQAFHIGDPSEIFAARRAATYLAKSLDFNDLRRAQLELVITEAGTNIIKHAQRGELLLRALTHEDNFGIEIIAIDNGPGISNINFQMEDGNSTTGTYGGGLGAMSRLSQEFDIYSNGQNGAALIMVIWADTIPAPDEQWKIGAVCLPMEGEEVCGDAWTVEVCDNSLTLLVADGLGHGPEAARASQAAVTAIATNPGKSPAALMDCAHKALYGTRGAAVAISKINEARSELKFAGVGNIAVSVFISAGRKHLLSHNGIVGSNLRKLQEINQAWEEDALLIAHSDGLGTRWDLDQYPGLAQAHPGLIAAILYRDFSRGRDDVTVIVVRDITEF
ncbi:MAG: serine/threonine protein kinase [Gammaproteobacteria bacterium]|nr:MAG: serine/threonine protein kinase [Gammaproteobacteria bacterium]